MMYEALLTDGISNNSYSVRSSIVSSVRILLVYGIPYPEMKDEEISEETRKDAIITKGYFIYPRQLFVV